MRILQIGAGSMGTRRLRDLSGWNGVTLAVHDQRPDRRDRAHARFGVPVFDRFQDALDWAPDALVISTPPGTKREYIRTALERGLHHFSEADIWAYGASEIESTSARRGLVSAPSASLLFLPVVKALKAHVREHLGPVLFYQAFMATHMPSWHPHEGREYYAWHRDTTAAREMIPFELTWLAEVFSPAVEVAGRYDRHGRLEATFEDTWSLSMRLAGGGAGQLAISMACPVSSRRGSAFGAGGMISWDIYRGEVALTTAEGQPDRVLQYGASKDTLEQSYGEEIRTFVDAVRGKTRWPQSYEASSRSCATLAAGEQSHASGKWVPVQPGAEPERLSPSSP